MSTRSNGQACEVPWTGRRIGFCAVTVLGLAVGGVCQNSVRQYSLFTDHKSHRLDDLITVIVDEKNKATNNAGTRTKTDSKTRFESEKGKGATSAVPRAKSKTDAQGIFDGEGTTQRRGDVNATVSARVVGVLTNGNLEVEGSKEVVINEETEILKVSGIVRPEDIDANNQVRSSSLANARITYSGRGSTSSAMEKGVLAMLFDWLF
jgi:flagellar L-ring protein precursor FlgH